MSYKRVIPRDLFNEANLLKCLGRVALLVNDGFAPAGLELRHAAPEEGFPVEMDACDGSICCPGLTMVAGNRRRAVPRRGLNARDPWPLYIVAFEGDDEREEEIAVFDDDGNWTEDFITWATEGNEAPTNRL